MRAAGVIILTTQLLALVLRKIRQPKVIAEVIGGILLGMCAASSLQSQSHDGSPARLFAIPSLFPSSFLRQW